MKLRRFWLVVVGTALTILCLFVLFELTELKALLYLPEPSESTRVPFALIGVSLLVLDVFLPVPSSIIMLAHGALFGVAIGTALSTVGALGATLFGHWVGQTGAGAFRRFLSEDELARARSLFERWGTAAILITRPVPILAETTAIVAGASGFPRGRVLLAGTLGSLPGAFLYAWAGANGLDSANGSLAFAVVLGISAALWAFGRKRRR